MVEFPLLWHFQGVYIIDAFYHVAPFSVFQSQWKVIENGALHQPQQKVVRALGGQQKVTPDNESLHK